MLRFCALLVSLILGSQPVFAAAFDPSDTLMAAFGSKCEGANGALFSTAFGFSQNLKDVAQALQEDPACQGVASLLTEISDLSAESLYSNEAAKGRGKQIDQQVKDLEVALNTVLAENDSRKTVLIDSYSSQIAALRIEQVKLRDFTDPNPAEKQRDRVRRFGFYAVSLMQRLRVNLECRNKYPQIASQVGAQILALSSDVGSGLVGAVMMGGGALINEFIEFARDQEFADALKGVLQERQAQAVGCAIQAVATNYCEARDLRTVINSTKIMHGDAEVLENLKPQWKGISTISRNLPVFLNWVSQINAVSSASGPAQAAEKKAGVNLRNNVELMRIDYSAAIARSKRELLGDKTDEEKQSILRDLVNSLAAISTSNIVSISLTGSGQSSQTTIGQGPLARSFQLDPVCGAITYFMTLGTEKACLLMSTERDCQTCLTRRFGSGGNPAANPPIPNSIPPLPPAIDKIEESSKNLLTEGSAFAASQLALVKESNPRLVLANARKIGENRVDPISFINEAIAYLEILKNDPNSISTGQLKLVIEDISNRLKAVIQIEARSDDPTTLSTLLNDELSPQGDIFFVPNALTQIVKRDLDHQLEVGQFDPALSRILQLSLGGTTSELVQNVFGLDSVTKQIINTQRLSRQNLKTLGQLFGWSLFDRVAQLDNEIRVEKLNGRNFRDAEQELAFTCVILELLPENSFETQDQARRFCYNRTFRSIYPKSSLDVVLNDVIFPAKPADMTCLVYDFFRNSRLYELSRLSAPRFKKRKINPEVYSEDLK